MHRLLIAVALAVVLNGTANAANLYLACADVLPEKRELFLKAALRTADIEGDHGVVKRVDKQTCRLLVSMARAKTIPMEQTAGPDTFMNKDNIPRAMNRSYPTEPK